MGIPIGNPSGKLECGDSYKIDDTGVARKSRCLTGMGRIS